MMRRLLLTTLSIFLLSLDMMVFASEKIVIGRIEYIQLNASGNTIKSKIDTGAFTSSLDVSEIEEFTRDQQAWVRFTVTRTRSKQPITLERKVKRYVRIKKRTVSIQGEKQSTYEERPVVELELCLGQQSKVVEVNLVNREHFVYPMLIGHTALVAFEVLVDPNKEFLLKPACSKP
jgi:hypothetical protein